MRAVSQSPVPIQREAASGAASLGAYFSGGFQHTPHGSSGGLAPQHRDICDKGLRIFSYVGSRRGLEGITAMLSMVLGDKCLVE